MLACLPLRSVTDATFAQLVFTSVGNATGNCLGVFDRHDGTSVVRFNVAIERDRVSARFDSFTVELEIWRLAHARRRDNSRPSLDQTEGRLLYLDACDSIRTCGV